jgi:hypothetical protein
MVNGVIDHRGCDTPNEFIMQMQVVLAAIPITTIKTMAKSPFIRLCT